MPNDPTKITGKTFTTPTYNTGTGSSKLTGGKSDEVQPGLTSDNFEQHGKVYDLVARLRRKLMHGEQKPEQSIVSPESTVSELKPEDLRRTLSPESFQGVAASSDFPKAGQERLLSSLKIASGIRNEGYNVFITRYGGDGESVAKLLQDFPPDKVNPKDYAYVRNFEDVNAPVLLIFAPGKAKAFQNTMGQTLKNLEEELPNAKGSSDFINGRVDIEQRANKEIGGRQANLEKELNKVGFGIERIEREEGVMGMVGLRLIVPAGEAPESAAANPKEKGAASPKMQVVVAPLEALEKEASTAEEKGLKPLFILTNTTVGPAYMIADQAGLQAAAENAVKMGKQPPQAYDLESLRAQFNEFQRKSLEMNAANEATQVKANKELQALVQKMAGGLIDKAFEPVRKAYPTPYVEKYLGGIKDSIIKSMPLFINRDEALAAQEKDKDGGDGPSMLYIKKKMAESFLPNVVSCSECNCSGKYPIVYEKDPTWENLLGTIQEPNMIIGERDLPLNRHKNIKGGSLLRAQGGYLVVNLLDAARSGSLGGLLRAVKTGKLEIEPPNWSSNRPEPIPLNVKVVLLDPEGYYDMLASTDSLFENMFIKAPYDASPKAEDDNMKAFAGNLLARAQDQKLLPVSPPAMAGVMEETMREAESKERFSADFAGALDLLREANVEAKNRGASAITGDDVNAALDARKFRHGLREDRMHEMIDKQIFKVATTGSAVGQINGLVVTGNYEKPAVLPKGLYDVMNAAYGQDWIKEHEQALLQAKDSSAGQNLAEGSLSGAAAYQFGLPARITATVSNSRQAGIVPNDKDSGYLGPSTLKAFANIGSFLKEKFGADGNIEHFEAHVSFEQNYGGIDGDSATQAKTIALLSSLSGVPVKQGIAITGSMDVHGNTQAIGGVNYKIAGFYDICKEQGLDGTQGCCIPADNVGDLMLRPDIVQAVKDGKFHIWPVKKVDEAVEVMTGVKAGQPDKNGNYPDGTVYGLVQKRLENYREKAKGGKEDHHHGWNIAK